MAETRGGGKTEAALRVTEKEKDAREITIYCLEVPGNEKLESYRVVVRPKTKENEPGSTHKGMGSYTEPIERLFEGKDAHERTLAYLDEAL
jgi:hypothetical protein